MRTQSVKDYTLTNALSQCWTVVKTTAILYDSLVFFIGRMRFLVSFLDNADPLFALVITPGFYLHHLEVADQDSASGSL